ncbi:hypothetical protein [Variovorax atrisoli]|uniref:hypothetical protein n=1 Tax=Variovorax atrisoli TaxID=3394203 RepID=UPI00160F01C7|nr:hypothetical protein [Variovorax sp. BK613]MBB3641034.1 hypothetical protein [Variovorax sp. BK613]
MTADDYRELRQHLTPKERLALSRRALVRQLNGGVEDDDDGRYRTDGPRLHDDDLEYAHHDAHAAAGPDGLHTGHPQGSADAEPGGQRGAGAGRGRRKPQNVWIAVGRSVLERWWRRHPAHAVGQLARPMLEHYARKEPVKVMAVAAATGSLLVLVRPWRLLSATAVLAAVLKTSDVADLITTLMSKSPSSPRPPRKDTP